MKANNSNKHILLVGGTGQWASLYWGESLVCALDNGDMARLTVVDFAVSPPHWLSIFKKRRPDAAIYYLCLSELLVPYPGDSYEVDVVIVCTPHKQHLSVCRELLGHGKSLLADNVEFWIEKPLTPFVEEAEDFERFIRNVRDRRKLSVSIRLCDHYLPRVEHEMSC